MGKNNKKNNTRIYDKGINAPDKYMETVEYKMTEESANNILRESKSNSTPQEILCNYVNSTCGLKGYCTRVTLF